MVEYIDREAANLALAEQGFDWDKAKQALASVPAADVVPVVHGRWAFETETLNTLSQTKCNICGWWTLDPSVDGAYNFCPNCGAKMDGGADND